MTFSLESKMGELEEIEKYMQLPDIDLDEAIRKHEYATKVAKEIMEYLEKSESVFKKIDMSIIE